MSYCDTVNKKTHVFFLNIFFSDIFLNTFFVLKRGKEETRLCFQRFF